MGVYDDEGPEEEDPDGRIWVSLEATATVKRGEQVAPPAAGLRRDDSGLSLVSGGRHVCAKLLHPHEVSGFFAELPSGAASAGADDESTDARTLTIRTTATGRHREFSSLAEDCAEEVFDDFPLTGPRTSSWCLQFLRRRRCPVDHHMMFRTVTRLGADAWGMGEHEHLCQLVELAGCYDQLDLTNLAFAEAAFRRIQTIEWVHHDRVKDMEATAGDRITVEEMTAFSGVSRSSDVLMVAPALLSHVKTVVETDATIMKSVRKAREERELRRKNQKTKGGKAAGKDGE